MTQQGTIALSPAEHLALARRAINHLEDRGVPGEAQSAYVASVARDLDAARLGPNTLTDQIDQQAARLARFQ